MIEKTCNLWIEPADWRCIPTIGVTNDDGTAQLDDPLAKEAGLRYAALDVDLGRLLSSRGNHVHELRPGLLSFPIKQYLWSGVDLTIVRRSAYELLDLVGDAKTLLPRPKPAPNDPPWEKIAEVLAFLPDNIVVVAHC